MRTTLLIYLLLFATLTLSVFNQVSQADQNQNLSPSSDPNLPENVDEIEPTQGIQSENSQYPDRTRLLVNMVTGY